MRFAVSHTTRYRYSRPVFLEPHTFRFRPRSDSSQRLVHFELEIEPEPMAAADALDPEGNCVTHAWFEETTDQLVIRASFEAETLRRNPFDYMLLDASANDLPMRYPVDLHRPLATHRSPSGGWHSPVAEFARSIGEEVGGKTLAFLAALNDRIYRTNEVEYRHEGHPVPPEQTLESGRGSCRDVTTLFMECCRSLGLAARFVSGYEQGDPDSEERHMHAWAEVYLPGGGWRGYDPTHGLAVADGHVAVAAGIDPEHAAPTSGTFRGTGATSTMVTKLELRVSEGQQQVQSQGSVGSGFKG